MNVRMSWSRLKHLLASYSFKKSSFSTSAPTRTLPNFAAKSPHTPVLLNEALNALDLQPLKTVIDMTFGAGGHTREILSNFEDCHVIALDRDEIAYNMAEKLSMKQNERVTPLLGKFSELDSMLKELKYEKGSIDAVLIDAGCSSMQFDEAYRGFSLSKDGPLDMRMDGPNNPNQLTAADVVNHLDRDELANIIREYGEERKADEIAQSIVENRPFQRTKQLAAAVGNAVSLFDHSLRSDSLGRRSHTATKTFMALRIFVNDEMNELYQGLKCAEKYLRHDGRLITITFHSLEDKLVRTFVRRSSDSRPSPFQRTPNRNKSDFRPSFIVEKDLMSAPTLEEVAINPRARSGLLRVATRCRS